MKTQPAGNLLTVEVLACPFHHVMAGIQTTKTEMVNSAIMNAEMAMVVMVLCAGRSALMISATTELTVLNLTLMVVVLAILAKMSA